MTRQPWVFFDSFGGSKKIFAPSTSWLDFFSIDWGRPPPQGVDKWVTPSLQVVKTSANWQMISHVASGAGLCLRSCNILVGCNHLPRVLEQKVCSGHWVFGGVNWWVLLLLFVLLFLQLYDLMADSRTGFERKDLKSPCRLQRHGRKSEGILAFLQLRIHATAVGKIMVNKSFWDLKYCKWHSEWPFIFKVHLHEVHCTCIHYSVVGVLF